MAAFHGTPFVDYVSSEREPSVSLSTVSLFFIFLSQSPEDQGFKMLSHFLLSRSTLGCRSSIFSKMSNRSFLRPLQEGGSTSSGKNVPCMAFYGLLARISTRVILPISASALGLLSLPLSRLFCLALRIKLLPRRSSPLAYSVTINPTAIICRSARVVRR